MVKNPLAMGETWVRYLAWEDPLEKEMQATPVFSPREFHEQRILAGYSLWGHKESDTVERLSYSHIPGGTSSKESICQCRRHKKLEFDPWVRNIPWKREWQPTPIYLPGKSHGQRSLVGYSLWACKELDMTKRLTLPLSLYRQIWPVLGRFSTLMKGHWRS